MVDWQGESGRLALARSDRLARRVIDKQGESDRLTRREW